MTQEVIDVGVNADSGDGDSLYEAGNKINSNFEDFFDLVPVKADIKFLGNNITSRLSNADIDVHPSGTGSIVFPGIRFNDNNIEALNTNDDLKISASGSGRVVIAGLGFGGTSISSSDSTSININENLIVDGSGTFGGTFAFSGAQTFPTGSTFGTLTFANGSITDSTGAISFGNENLTTTGTLAAGDNSVIGNLTLTDGSITDSSGAISFGNENLTTTGDLQVDGTSTFGALSVGGATSVAFPVTVDNLTFNDNIISTSSNADLLLSPGGTGVVTVANLTIDSSINFTDNVIKVTTSNADLVLSANGTGSVEINNIDLDSGTIDNVVIGANEPSTGLFDSSNLNYTTLVIPTKLTFSGNTLSTSRTNDNLEFEASGSGKVVIDGLSMPITDGQTGEFLQTNGSGVIGFGSTGIALGVSDIQDAKNTIGFTSKTIIDSNTAVGAHEKIIETNSVIDSFPQSKYDSAWYLVLSRSEAADSAIEFQFQKHSVIHGTADGSTFEAFSNSFQPIKTSENDLEIDLTSDLRSGVDTVRLLGRAGLLADSSVSSGNAVSYFRIGLGDDDSSGTQAGSGLAQTKLVADLDSAASAIDSWAAGSFRGAKYFISINNTTTNEVSSTEVLLVHDGTDAYVQEYNTISSIADSTPLATFSADISSGDVRLLGANGTAGTCRVTMYRILLSDSESDSNETYVDVIGAKTVAQIDKTTVDHVTRTLVSRQGFETALAVDSFASSEYDSAWYFTLLRDQSGGRYAFHKYSVLHGTSDDSSIQAFVTDSGVVRSEEFDIVSANAVVDDGIVQLKLTGIDDGSTVVSNNATAYRIGLGDGDSTGYVSDDSVLSTIVINTDVDSASESVDSFAHADHRGAKYFVSVMNASGGEVMNTELLVVHDGSAAYITSYNEHSSGNTGASTSDVLATFTAAISGSNVVVSAAGLQTNLRITMYRILLADDQSATTGTNVNVISAVTVSSSATTIDTFSTNTYAGAHYIIIGSAGDGKSIMEATVISDGTEASVSEGPQVSTKGTSQLELTASHSSTTTTLQASSTSGGSTTVNAYRIHLPKVPIGTTYTEIDSITQSSKQAASYIAVTKQTDNKSQIDDISVVADAAAAYNVRVAINSDSSSADLVNWTTVLDSGAIKLRAELADSTASAVTNAWKVELARAEGQPSTISTLDSFDKTVYRSAMYNVSIVVQDGGSIGLFEVCDIRITHDGSTPYISVFGRTNSSTTDLVAFSADIVGDDVRLRGQISTSNTHEVTVVRRVIEL